MSESSPQANVAYKAQAFYSVGKYGKALECLQQLAIQMGEKDDPRVQFNLILSEHANNAFKEPLSLRGRIIAIRNSLKERSSKTVARVKESLSLEDDMDQNDDTDTDTSILLYNLAALNFHEKQYGASRQILHSLFARIEVLDESLGVHVCFLLLDVLLHSARGNVHTENDRERFQQHAAALLSYLERPHNFGPPLVVPPDNDATAAGGSERKDGEGDGSSDDKRGGRNLEMIEFNFRLHLYKAKVRLLQCQMKTSKKEIKNALEIFQRELRPAGSGDASTTAAPGGNKHGGGGGDSDDEETPVALTTATYMNVAASDPSLPPAGVANVAALYLKANLEYLRQNYRKALKLLASCQKGEGPQGPGGKGPGPLYLNDMGCLHSKMGLHAVALQYLQKALSCFESGPLPGQRPLEADGRVLPHALCEVVYNTGVQLLLIGKYSQAFRCFENASLLFYNRPRLWLRMAECCIQHYRDGQRTRLSHVKDRLVRRVMGQGRHRRVSLPLSNDPKNEAPLREEKKGDLGLSNGVGGGGGKGQNVRGQCTLPYAVKCLQNVLFLLSIASQGGGRSRLHVSTLLGAKAVLKESTTTPAAASSSLKEGGGGGGESTSVGGGNSAAAASAGEAEQEGLGGENGTSQTEVNQQDETLLEQVALLNLSYVYLSLHEPVLALHHAEQLLSRPNVNEAKQVTAHTYAAEALCALGRSEEALRHLLPNNEPLSEDAAAAALQGQKQKDSKQVTADSFLPAEHFAARARSALHLNLASVYLLQGNLPAAEKCVRVGLAACPTSPDALRSLVFILLRKGQTASALEVLKSRRPQQQADG